MAGARPKARREGLVLERLPGELLVYDEERDVAHCLGEPVATVFELSDGRRTIPELSRLAGGGEADIETALGQLRQTGLLAEDGLSRRQALLAGGAAAAVPLITTIVAPLPAAAQSSGAGGVGAACTAGTECQSGLDCVSGSCCVPEGGTCTSNADCCNVCLGASEPTCDVSSKTCGCVTG